MDTACFHTYPPSVSGWSSYAIKSIDIHSKTSEQEVDVQQNIFSSAYIAYY